MLCDFGYYLVYFFEFLFWWFVLLCGCLLYSGLVLVVLGLVFFVWCLFLFAVGLVCVVFIMIAWWVG